MLTVVYVQPIWLIMVEFLGMICLWSVIAWAANRASWRRRWKAWNGCFVLLSAFLVLYATLLDRAPGEYGVVLVPFSTFAEAKVQPELYRSMLMNIFLFVPFGAALSQVFPKGWTKRRKILLVLCAGVVLSGFVEGMQYRFALGRAEIDDVLTNALGAVVGGGGVELVGHWLDRRGTDLLHRIQTKQKHFKR